MMNRDDVDHLPGPPFDLLAGYGGAARQHHGDDLSAEATSILDAVQDGVIVADERGTIELANPVACEMFGWSECELRGQNVSVLAPEPWQSGHDGYLEHYRATGEPSTATGLVVENVRKVTAVRRDGVEFPIELSVGEMVSGDGRRHFVAAIHDRAGRVAAEQAKQEAEERYRAIFEASHDGILVAAGGRIVAANPAMCEMLGYAHHELIGMSHADFVYPDDAGTVVSQREALLRGEQVPSLQRRRLLRKDGATIETEVSSGTAGPPGSALLFASYRDVTAQRAAERHAMEADALYRNLFEQASDMVFVADIDGYFQLLNPAGQRMIGYEGAELSELSLADLMSPTDADIARARLREKLVGATSTTYEVVLTGRDGSTVRVELSTQLVWRGGRATAIQGVARPVSPPP